MEQTQANRELTEGLNALEAEFMSPCVEYGQWYEVDGPDGSEVIPADLICPFAEFDKDLQWNTGKAFDIPAEFADYCENTKAYSIEPVTGWGARLSASGYMDCTPWSVFETREQAQQYLVDTYGAD